MAETTPVTVLTGFLGAGKTTLLNHLLRQPELARTAVLVNEFGEIGLDHLLVEKLDDTTVLLNAGCLCCSVRGDLARVLREMLPRARRDDISRIVIETTGLADPVPILATLMTDPVAASAYRLDGIVTVIDAVNGMIHLDMQEEAVRQVAVADRIIISKTDLVGADIDSPAHPVLSEDNKASNPAVRTYRRQRGLALLRGRVRVLNPGAPVTEAAHGAVDPSFVIHAGLFDPATKIPDVMGWLNAAAFDVAGEHHRHDPNRHDARIGAFCITFDQPLDWQGLAMWLEMLVAARGENLLRVKGILNLKGHDQPVAIHAARHLMHPPLKLAAWPESDPRTSRIVFITRDLPRAVIEDGLRAFQTAAWS